MRSATALVFRESPKWGRLGDEVLDGCASHVLCEGSSDWDPLPLLNEWDVSQEFLVAGLHVQIGHARALVHRPNCMADDLALLPNRLVVLAVTAVELVPVRVAPPVDEESG